MSDLCAHVMRIVEAALLRFLGYSSIKSLNSFGMTCKSKHDLTRFFSSALVGQETG